MTWYQSLAPQSVSSCKDLTEQFCRHFTASRRHPMGGPRGSLCFSNYTPLTVSREHILFECHASEFRQGGIKFSKQVPAKPHQDTTKWY
ncbi:hypothetical protein A2U01_0073963, partial [Trifolium medium]|nr:hypothetical protein [Trifolium medium]